MMKVSSVVVAEFVRHFKSRPLGELPLEDLVLALHDARLSLHGISLEDQQARSIRSRVPPP
jgi:hypothetical protein